MKTTNLFLILLLPVYLECCAGKTKKHSKTDYEHADEIRIRYNIIVECRMLNGNIVEYLTLYILSDV